MAFLLDNNIADDLGDALRAAPFGYDVRSVRDFGLDDATDARILYEAYQQGLVLLTHDQGYPGLDEAWAEWMTNIHGLGPHPGILQIEGYGPDDDLAARKIDAAVKAGWQARGALWLLDLKRGWRRMRPKRRWSTFDPDSPVGLF